MKLYSPETTHWYTRQGRPMHTVLNARGEPRPTDLRDARKLDLLPSVTNVLGVIAKPELINWKMEQAVLAALTLPRTVGESLDAFAMRVVEDGKAKVTNAAEFGTKFHAGAERIAQNPLALEPEEPLHGWLAHYRDWFQVNCERLVWTEQVLVSEDHGFAGMADLLMVHRERGVCLVDLKTQDFKGRSSPRIYQSWLYQLAAYAQIVQPLTCMNLIVNTAEPQPVREHVWTGEELRAGWDVFEAAHLIWRNEKNYNPCGQRKPVLTRERAALVEA